jgi:putative serine protease PepD
MTDPRPEPAPDPAGAAPAAGQSPPPGAWWSRPDGQWGAPRPDGHGEGERTHGWSDQTQPFARSGPPQPAYGTSYGAGPYGAPGAPQQTDPWSSPTTRATFPSGAAPMSPPGGPPVDSIGHPVKDPSRSGGRRGLGTAAAVLATALIAGSVGGLLGARSQDDGNLLDPSASLGGGGSSSASVDRAPESVAGIAAKVMQSTVSIAVSGRGGQGTGSGVVIRSDGYILTNNHVVESAEDGGEITVTLDGAEGDLPAEIVGLDPVTDLAVIQVQGGGQMPAAALGQSRDLVVGDPVIAIGSPLGLSGTVTTGIVSALNRTVNTPAKDGTSFPLFNAIQTDAAINPGNSGGALVNARGEVIGINSAIATLGGGLFGGEQTGGSIGVGFAIPVDEARSVAEEIIRTGKATHPSIGISATTVVGDERKGALVRALTPGGAAGAVGLRPNDLIVRLDDTEVTSVDELILATREHKVGDTVTVTYLRGDEERTVEIELQDLQAN